MILPVPKEIERKYLVRSDGWREGADGGRRLRQAYLAAPGRAVVRIRVEEGAQALLTIKSAAPELSRDEFEYPVPLGDADALIALRHGSIVEKTRFLVPHGGRRWEVDVYSGDNAGLVIAEIELQSEEEHLDTPEWVGSEVTGHAQFYASRLALAPFRLWPDPEPPKTGAAA